MGGIFLDQLSRHPAADGTPLHFLHQMEQLGAAVHGYMQALAMAPTLPHAAPVADAVHLLTLLHHARPLLAHLVDHVVHRTHPHCAEPQALAQWQAQVCAALEEDRRWLMDLMLHFGPSPFVAARQSGEQKIHSLRRYIVTMLQSDRCDCALGAMICLAQQSDMLRLALNNGFAGTPLAHPADGTPALRSASHKLVLALISGPLECPSRARALAFGVQQMAQLFTDLLTLLEARQAHGLP